MDSNVWMVQNGITIYKPGSVPTYGPDVPEIPNYMYSRFGWKIIEVNGRKGWQAMTELEYLDLVGQFYGIEPSRIDLNLVMCGGAGDTGCNGECPDWPDWPDWPDFPRNTFTRFCVRVGGGDRFGCMCIGFRNQEK